MNNVENDIRGGSNIEFTDNGKSYQQGKYTPSNPEKYLGDVNDIVFRSSWELYAFQFLDRNPNVLKWGSEIVPIAYRKPMLDSRKGWKPANYFPDLFVIFKDKTGTIVKELIEIKPFKQMKPSRSRNAKTKLTENYNYVVNQAKWDAARHWCTRHGINFRVCSEKDLFR